MVEPKGGTSTAFKQILLTVMKCRLSDILLLRSVSGQSSLRANEVQKESRTLNTGNLKHLL